MCRIASGSGKYIGFGLNGTVRNTIVDIFNIIQKVRDTGIHLDGHESTEIRNNTT